MRQIALDTETTGLDLTEGHRLIEIAGIEMVDRRRTDEYFHTYLNPERDIPSDALTVHGLSNTFLKDKPLFSEKVEELIDFIKDSELIIHNASFDIGFLNAAIKQLGRCDKIEDYCEVKDTLTLAREMHPGQRNSLDALCRRYDIDMSILPLRRYGIDEREHQSKLDALSSERGLDREIIYQQYGADNSKRQLHGARLDAILLTEVYLRMTSGQESMYFSTTEDSITHIPAQRSDQPPIVILPNKEEMAAHKHYLEKIKQASGGICLFDRIS